jgi:ferredoxin
MGSRHPTNIDVPNANMNEPGLDPQIRAALSGPFGAPAFVLPWIDRLLEPVELTLIAALAQGPLSLPEAAARLPVGTSPAFFDRAYRRGVIDLPTPDTLVLTDFAVRLNIWILFEGWKDVPPSVREQLAEWELGQYIEDKRAQVESLLAGDPLDPTLENPEYLLLHEAEELVERAPHVYLWPCDCRAAFGRCSKPSLVCLWFENARGLGWEISRERAIEVLRDADRHGLMHTGGVMAGEHGTAFLSRAICNCCADCCFPHLAAQRLNAVGVWPRSRYVAVRDAATCRLCGNCTRRCPFEAFTAERSARLAEGNATKAAPRHVTAIDFDAALCRGCGLCATGCPEGAIAMQPLDGVASSSI